MKNNYNLIKTLKFAGKFIFVCASGLAGFIIGGPIGASFGIIAGFLGAHLLQKSLQNCPL